MMEDIMKAIESLQNPTIKGIKKLHRKKYRDLEQCYIIEGEHLVEEAVANGVTFRYLMLRESEVASYQSFIDYVGEEASYSVTDGILKSLSQLPNQQDVLGVVYKKEAVEMAKEPGNYLLLDNVQDPGNVGTMIRTADAAGFTHVILGSGCADIYSSKVLRSMQGSQYHLIIEEKPLLETIEQLKQQNYLIIGTELNEEAKHFKEVTVPGAYALVMGNEGQGVSRDVLEATDVNTYIPILGQAESLNVGIAAGILMFSL